MAMVTNFTDRIMAYESGELGGGDTIRLFADLVAGGMAWSLQGHYGRTARTLIDNGVLSPEGTILVELDDEEEE